MLCRIVFRARLSLFLLPLLAITVAPGTLWPMAEPAAESDEMRIALDLANLLRAARAVISAKQDLINNPEIGDKGLTSEAVLAETVERFKKLSGVDPRSIDPQSRHGHLLHEQMTAIAEVMDENQDTINRPGVGFKGFVPAIFARLVNERFKDKVGDAAEIKVTAPLVLVRNRKSRPDPWEADVIQNKLLSPQWPKDQIFAATARTGGRDSFRVLVPNITRPGASPATASPRARSTSPAIRWRGVSWATSAA